jgi:hypothetical protein
LPGRVGARSVYFFERQELWVPAPYAQSRIWPG